MRTIEATYRIVTPMFCSGADQSRAELRLPSFKGVLRFWWRALAWSRNQDPERLHAEESSIFGSSGSQGRSRILLRDPSPGSVEVVEQRHNDWSAWQRYIGFGITDGGDRRTRQYVKPGTTWTIQFLDSGLDSEQFQQVYKALVALGFLGGLGARSRKGWGSVTLERLRIVQQPAGEESDESWRLPRTRESLRSALGRFLDCDAGPKALPGWTAVSSRASFAIGPAQKNAQAAHRYLVKRYREAVRSISPTYQRESFGLPRHNAERNTGKRRASPVFLHVHQATGGEAFPVATMLPAHFLRDQQDPRGGWSHLDSFLSSVEGS